MNLMLGRGQASFEYMMSYGWAVLVIVVLAVALWNLGVFNPSSITQSAGFSVLRPVAWNFVGGNDTSSYVTIAIGNIGGVDLTVAINGSNDYYTMKFRKPWAQNCGFINQPVGVRDDIGNQLSMTYDSVNGAWLVSIPAGRQIVINGTIVGANSTYQCGGPSGGSFNYELSYPYSIDQYNIQHSDSGSMNGKFQ
ncbi:MAG: hypothetical protein ABIF01_02615 [Candidatus Micrarchaeota archaeon]